MNVEKRLNSKGEAAVECFLNFGMYAAKQRYGQGIGYERFREFIEEKTGTRGQLPRFRTYGGIGSKDPFDFFMEKLADYVVKTKAEIEKKDEIIESLRQQIECYQSRHRDISFELIEATKMMEA